MTSKTGFPHELLSRSNDDRWSYFSNQVFAHPKLVDTLKLLMQIIRYSNADRLIMVIGPFGVGKTTLRVKFVNDVIAEFLPFAAQYPGHIPILSLNTIAKGSDSFDWIDFYTRALIELKELLIEYKKEEMDLGVKGVSFSKTGDLIVSVSGRERSLRRALENALLYRNVKYFLMDDAQHLQKIAGGRQLINQMDSIKSLADNSNTRHIMLGTYDLLNLTGLSGQLRRRTYPTIHFSRYLNNCDDDVKNFKRILKSFEQTLPLNEQPDFVKMWEYMYTRSLGCVGLLKPWVCDAFGDALENGDKTITKKHLKRHEYPPGDLVDMLQEVTDGEQKIETVKSKEEELRQALGLDSRKNKEPAAEEPASNGKEQRVGERNPKRDKVGRQENEDNG